MNLTDYDSRVAPVLDDIVMSSAWLRWYADKLLAHVVYLPARPDFKTKAEAELDKAIAVLEEGLIKLRAARVVYQEKDVR